MHGLIDNGEGFPTEDSIRQVLNGFNMGSLSDIPASFRGETGSITELIGRCRIEHLVTDWPRGFIGMVVGIATEAASGGGSNS